MLRRVALRRYLIIEEGEGAVYAKSISQQGNGKEARVSTVTTAATPQYTALAPQRLQNWKGSIQYEAAAVEVVRSVEDIRRIVKDKARYPSPVRCRGSHHSTTRCVVNEGGTVLDMGQMDRILKIDVEGKTITMEAGVLHIDAAKELEKHGLQFYVNIELGNMTVGSGSCCGTKDASFYSVDEGKYEFGQVASYVVGYKAVLPTGDILEVNEQQPELLEAMRSSFGMLGVIYEVTFKVKQLRPLAVEHVEYDVDEFAARVHDLVRQNRSMMLYLFPFLDRVVVEYRHDGRGNVTPGAWQWRARNFVWKTLSPFVGKTANYFVPQKGLRFWLIDAYYKASIKFQTTLLRAWHTSAADQIIRYPAKAGYASYTFSIWAFPQEEYPETIKAYFKFCKDYYKAHGFRCDMLNVGYSIAQDKSSLFSYTRRGPALTLDPVATGLDGWEAFLIAYNEFCTAHNGRPLFNQSYGLTPAQVKIAFGPEIEAFQQFRTKYDPEGRLYPEYFRQYFEPQHVESPRPS
jgi:L-gulonolactone oxidase